MASGPGFRSKSYRPRGPVRTERRWEQNRWKNGDQSAKTRPKKDLSKVSVSSGKRGFSVSAAAELESKFGGAVRDRDKGQK